MSREIAWGTCGRCGYPVGNQGWLVWDKAGRIGIFACQAHLRLIRAGLPGSTVEELQ